MTTLPQRLRAMADHTGLDAVAELLREAADTLDRREAVIRILEQDAAELCRLHAELERQKASRRAAQEETIDLKERIARADVELQRAVLAERKEWQGVVDAVIREMPRRGQVDSLNAPGHAHQVPGIWDDDNGPLAGTECAWCKAWNTAKAAILARSKPQGEQTCPTN